MADPIREQCLAAFAALLGAVAAAQAPAFAVKRLPHKAPRGSEAPLLVMWDGEDSRVHMDSGGRQYEVDITVDLFLDDAGPGLHGGLGPAASDILAQIRDRVELDRTLGGVAVWIEEQVADPVDPIEEAGADAYTQPAIVFRLLYETSNTSSFELPA